MWPFNRLSLFWKIFLWFWLAMFIMVSLSVVSWRLFSNSINFHPADPMMEKSLEKLGYILESNTGEPRKRRAIRNLLRKLAPPHTRTEHPEIENFQPFYLLSENGKDKNGSSVPEAVLALWHHSLQQKSVMIAIQGDFIFLGTRQVELDGDIYQLVISQYIGKFKGRMLLHLLSSISVGLLLSYLVMSALLCFLLAWSLTRPIRSLQEVSRRIADGEKVSAVETLGNRRDEFYRLAKDVDDMAKKIMETVSTQKQLLSDVSHELRSPLTRMQIALGLLDKSLGDGRNKHILRIEDECERMDEMIGQLLSIAALERGQLYEEEQRLDLSQLVKDIVIDAEFEAEQKNIRVESEIDESLMIQGYYGLLRSSIENILRNAIRYSPENESIKVNLSKSDAGISLSIADHGPGVEPEFLEHIFQPFYRTDEARSREQGGAGLGLAITARSIAVHHGKVYAQANQPNGLNVVVELPGIKPA